MPEPVPEPVPDSAVQRASWVSAAARGLAEIVPFRTVRPQVGLHRHRLTTTLSFKCLHEVLALRLSGTGSGTGSGTSFTLPNACQKTENGPTN